MNKLATVCVALSLSGCASMFTGTSSIVNVTSTPTGADCDIGGRGVHTPGNVSLSKSGDDLIANCQKEGYLSGTTRVESSFNPVTLLDTLLGIPGALAYIIDFSTGAAFEYPEQVYINLLKEPPKPIPVIEEAPPKPISSFEEHKDVVQIEYFRDKKGRCYINDEYGNKKLVEKRFCQ
jgi:hypothetical protein